MGIWKCHVCLEKDKRISDKDAEIARLLSQLEAFREMALPPSSKKVLTPVVQELDKLLSGSDAAPIVGEDPIAYEASLLLSGNYDNSQTDHY